MCYSVLHVWSTQERCQLQMKIGGTGGRSCEQPFTRGYSPAQQVLSIFILCCDLWEIRLSHTSSINPTSQILAPHQNPYRALLSQQKWVRNTRGHKDVQHHQCWRRDQPVQRSFTNSWWMTNGFLMNSDCSGGLKAQVADTEKTQVWGTQALLINTR